MKILRAYAITAAACALAANSASASQIAQFHELTGLNDFLFTNNGTSVTASTKSIVSGSSLVMFSYSADFSPPTTFGTANINALLTLSAVSTTASPDGFDEGGFYGFFTIIDKEPGVAFGTNLLSGTFGPNAKIYGIGGAAGAMDSTLPTLLSEIAYTSDYLTFSPIAYLNFSLSLSNTLPRFSFDSHGFVNYATAAGTGTFAADPAPAGNGVPEPATMVLFGSALVGLGLLGRKRFTR